MRAVEVIRYGGPEVVRMVDRPEPCAGSGEVVVKQVFVGVNFKDI